MELYGAAQPKPGQVVGAKLDDVFVWVGIVESISEYRVETGTRSMTLACRSRDATPAWRSASRVTIDYPQGTRLDVIAKDVARSVGLLDSEILLPSSSAATPHSSVQLAAISAWQMLETLLLPTSQYPMVDALGRLKAISRDCKRPSDILLTDDRIIAVTGSKSTAPISKLRLKWLDPTLTKVEQQGQILTGANITAGFFQIKQEQEVSFSVDQSQRASNTYMVTRQSANNTFVPVCSENYAALSETKGRITLNTYVWVPALLSYFLAIKASGMIYDIAPTSGGPTITVGRRVQAALELTVLLIMVSMGTGVYEIWGTPYDYVKGRNTTEAYNSDAEDWEENSTDIESDFIASESHAQGVAGTEFVYRARSASSYNATIVDDPRIEVGDILELPDASRIYVTSFNRDLTFGAPAELEVEGFQV